MYFLAVEGRSHPVKRAPVVTKLDVEGHKPTYSAEQETENEKAESRPIPFRLAFRSQLHTRAESRHGIPVPIEVILRLHPARIKDYCVGGWQVATCGEGEPLLLIGAVGRNRTAGRCSRCRDRSTLRQPKATIQSHRHPLRVREAKHRGHTGSLLHQLPGSKSDISSTAKCTQAHGACIPHRTIRKRS